MDSSTIWKIIDKYFEDNPQSLVRHHIESYNDFFKNGIFQIFKEKNPVRISTRFDEKIKDYRSKCVMYFGGKDGSKIYFGKPVIYDDDSSHYMYPNEARLRNMTYGMTIHYDIEVEFIDILEEGEQPMIVGGDPYMDETDGGGNENDIEGGAALKYRTDGGEFKEQTAGADNNEVPILLGGSGKGLPVRKGQKRRKAAEMTTAETALFREETEKSMVAPNTQKRTIMLEKILLGKFPIMLQSNYCVLTGMPREIRHTMGECLNDVGGYFVIDGKEKTVVSQEKFGDNMLYIRESGDETYLYSAEIRSVSENVSKPIRTLSVKIMAPTKKYTFKNIVVNVPNVRKPVPLFIVFRALGIVSDKQIITMCLLDLNKYEQMVDLFIPSVHDAGGILTQRNALKYIATLTKGKTIPHALEILADYFLPHVGEINFIQKAYYLGYVVFRLLSVYTGLEIPTDRDNFKYKRIELVGSLIYDLFREYYTIQQKEIQLAFESIVYYNPGIYANNLHELIIDKYKEVFSKRTVEAGFKKAFKGNWGAQTHTKRIGVVQDLNRLSHNSMMSHLRKTNLPLDASVKLVGPRVLHSTQWGIFDPIDTPDGGNIGIHKHLSISAYVTQGYSREPIIHWLREKAKMKLLEECSPSILSTMTKVIVNGLWAGAITSPIETVQKMKLFRRNGLIPTYTSVTFDIQHNTIFIYTDAGRICRPIFYRDEESGKMSYDTDIVKKYLEEDEFKWNELIAGFNNKKDKSFDPNNYKMYELNELYDGMDAESNPARLTKFLEKKAIIDYLDANETEDALIAMNAEDLEKDNKRKHTHMEIHESFIFGMMSNLINFPENNPATRNSFSCGQSKQACSMYHTNYQVRMDKTAVVLNSGQVPLVKTRYLEHINHESNPYGENAIVAIMCYTGYNVEDAILINEGALKRGLFRTTYYSTYETHEEKSKSGDVSTEKIFTNIENDTTVIGTKPGYDYSKLDKYGIVRENTQMNEKTVLIGLTATNSEAKGVKVDESKTPKKGQLGIVDKTFITYGEEGTRIAKVRIREERIPNIGDKMASRAGQKGTIGLVVREEDMPFTKDGIRPDIIVNPHALPTRMTIGQLVECIIGKASAMYGGYSDCTAFINNGSKTRVFGNMLTKVGYHSSGNEVLYNGMTGQQLEAEIFMGPNYYMRLKHMVKDKINYRALGPRTALTRQPVSGRANDGGLRIGEMERDSVISHGMSEFLRESMMERGDKYYMAVCNNTGMLAVYNPSKNLFMSPMADGPIKYVGSLDGKDMRIENITKFGRSYSVVAVPYSLKLLIQELQTINVQMRIITEDNIQQLENMGYSKNIDNLTFNATRLKKDWSVAQYVVYDTKNILEHLGKEKNNYGQMVLKKNVMLTPESLSPEGLSSEELSPEFAETSPAYQANEEELLEMFNQNKNPNSPEYNPSSPYVSPEYNPNSPYVSPVYNPNSPNPNVLYDSPTYIPETPNLNSPVYNPLSPYVPSPQLEQLNVLSEQARMFNLGESVHYRGDLDPNRFWKITYIGDPFIKIETDDSSGGIDTLLMVTATDIYRHGDYPYSPPYVNNENVNQQPMTGGGMPNMNGFGQMPQGVPFIFNPTFKMVGGNDFSSGGGEGGETTQPSMPMPMPVQSNSSGGESIAPQITGGSESSQDGGAAKKLNFGEILIRKLGM